MAFKHESFASAPNESNASERDLTVEGVAGIFKQNISEFTKADTVSVDFGEDSDGFKTLDIRVGYEGEEAKTISFHVTGPDSMDIPDLLMLARSREQITGLFGKTSSANEYGNDENALEFGQSGNGGYDDQDLAA